MIYSYIILGILNERCKMSKQKYLKYCSECAKINDIPGAKYHVHGYKSFYDSDNHKTCLECGNELTQFSMTCDDYKVLTHISTDPTFMDSMIKLHDENIVEYQLKLSQFKTQLSQTQAREENNIPKCPTCSSTNIHKISGLSKAGSVAMWGIFSRKVHKQWHCDSCGTEF